MARTRKGLSPVLYGCIALVGLAALIFYRDHWLSSEHRALSTRLDVLTRRVDLLTKAVRDRRDRDPERTVRMSEEELAHAKGAAKRMRSSQP